MDLPAPFLEKMRDLLGEEYEDYLRSFQEKRVYGLRINTLKLSPEQWERMDPFGTRKIPWVENGYYYEEEMRPGKHPYYFAGLYYLQEPSAMTPGSRLPICPGDRVLDLCAAPGGKSTQLAARLNGSGLLVSNDISNSRAKALLKNLELFGVSNSVILSESPHRLAEHFPEFFDKILIDAPCSGEGMFRKDPSVIKSWERNGNAFYEKLQKEIVTYALAMLKPGGMLLYSTCTFHPGENEGIVAYMKKICPELRILPIEGYEGFGEGRPDKIADGSEDMKRCVRIFPHRMQGEGHFLALLQKRTSEDFGEKPESKAGKRQKASSLKKTKNRANTKEEDLESFEAFARSAGLHLDPKRIQMRGDRMLYVPGWEDRFQGLRILRCGLLLGEWKNRLFEPSQALAMSLKQEQYPDTVNLPVTDKRVIKYLKGETLEIEDLTSKPLTGWQLVCVDGFPLGFAKGSAGTLKNKYLPGWRWQ